MRDTQEARVAEQKERAKIAHQEFLFKSAQVIGQSLSNNAQKIINDWLPAEKSAAYMEQLARIANTKADTSAKYAQIRFVTAQTLGVNIQNKIAQEVSESAIKATKAFNNYQETLYGGSVFGHTKASIDLKNGFYDFHNKRRNILAPISTKYKAGINLFGADLGFEQDDVSTYTDLPNVGYHVKLPVR